MLLSPPSACTIHHDSRVNLIRQGHILQLALPAASDIRLTYLPWPCNPPPHTCLDGFACLLLHGTYKKSRARCDQMAGHIRSCPLAPPRKQKIAGAFARAAVQLAESCIFLEASSISPDLVGRGFVLSLTQIATSACWQYHTKPHQIRLEGYRQIRAAECGPAAAREAHLSFRPV